MPPEIFVLGAPGDCEVEPKVAPPPGRGVGDEVVEVDSAAFLDGIPGRPFLTSS